MQSGILNQRQSSQGETQDTGTDSVLHYEIGQSSNFDVLIFAGQWNSLQDQTLYICTYVPCGPVAPCATIPGSPFSPFVPDGPTGPGSPSRPSLPLTPSLPLVPSLPCCSTKKGEPL